jgi:hypothetical protein
MVLKTPKFEYLIKPPTSRTLRARFDYPTILQELGDGIYPCNDLLLQFPASHWLDQAASFVGFPITPKAAG